MSKTPPLFCSFYTNQKYEALCHEILVPSLLRFGLDFSVEERPDLGSWEKNVRQKAPYLSHMLLEHPDRPIVWVDADAEIVALPKLLLSMPADVDMAAHVWTHRWDGVPELWSSVLFLRRPARPVMLAWSDENEKEGLREGWSDPNLQAVLERFPEVKAGRFMLLPPEYAWTEYVMRGALPAAVPIIRHERVSRPMWTAR